MKARIERDDLRRALRTVLPAVGRTNLAVLNGVHIVADQKAGTLALTCSDLQLTITAIAEAHIIAPGEMVAPARLLAAFTDKAPAGAVTIELDDRVLVTAGDATAALNALRADEWPRIPVADGDPVTLTPTHVDLIRRILPFAGVDDQRPVLTGLFVEGDKAATTDSFRLGEATLDGADLPATLLPAAAVTAALKGAEGDVTLTVGERCATLAHDGASWTTVLLEGAYPPYDRLLRDASVHYLTFDVERLTDALGRATVVDGPIGKSGTRSPVRIERDGDKARVWQTTADIGQVDDVVPCDGDYEGPIGFNPDYLAQMIAAAGTDEVTIELVDSLKPAMVRAEGLRLLLMPTRLA